MDVDSGRVVITSDEALDTANVRAAIEEAGYELSADLLIHASTAPNAVLHVLPVLPTELWQRSLTVAWTATAAITATYAPAQPAPEAEILAHLPELSREDALCRAAEHGDEHVLKFTDTAVESYDRTGGPAFLTVTSLVGELIDRP